jgi:hypothetical protein
MKYDNGALFPSYVTSNSIIGSCYSSHFKTLFKGKGHANKNEIISLTDDS